MASTVEIVNKAITLIGGNPIVSMDDDTNNARIASRIYDLALRSILSECKWNFATKRALLAEVTDDLDWYDEGETIVYQRPSDVIRIFETNDRAASWREEGDYIISDTDGLGVRYVYYIADTTKFPAKFTEALIDKLAAEMAYIMLNSSSIAEKYKGLYEKMSLPAAMGENSQIGVQQTVQDDAWTDSKYGNIAGDPSRSYG